MFQCVASRLGFLATCFRLDSNHRYIKHIFPLLKRFLINRHDVPMDTMVSNEFTMEYVINVESQDITYLISNGRRTRRGYMTCHCTTTFGQASIRLGISYDYDTYHQSSLMPFSVCSVMFYYYLFCEQLIHQIGKWQCRPTTFNYNRLDGLN